MQVRKSRKAYEERMLGVISDGSSGFIIQSNMKNIDKKHPGKPLVLAGRVPVKVTLENGPILLGDYLTSSSRPGYAMKATEPGATVGIALESLDGKGGETGKVLCFVKIGDRNSKSYFTALRAENESLKARVEKLERFLPK